MATHGGTFLKIGDVEVEMGRGTSRRSRVQNDPQSELAQLAEDFDNWKMAEPSAADLNPFAAENELPSEE